MILTVEEKKNTLKEDYYPTLLKKNNSHDVQLATKTKNDNNTLVNVLNMNVIQNKNNQLFIGNELILL